MNKNMIIESLQQIIAVIKDDMRVPTQEDVRFKSLSDGWVLDKVLKIEWAPSSGKRMNFEEALKYADSNGVRLPTVNELRSLVDYDRRGPAINTQFFNDTKMDDWYWSGTVVAGNPLCAWCVGFYYGDVSYYGKGNSLYVRPVRASQCLII